VKKYERVEVQYYIFFMLAVVTQTCKKRLMKTMTNLSQDRLFLLSKLTWFEM